MKFHMHVDVLLVVVVLSIVGCTSSRADVQNKLKTENREGKVVPITMPTKPDVIAPQPAPKIGHLLGKGSLAFSKGTTLEILNPESKTVARGDLISNYATNNFGPWSPSGNALLYQPVHNVLRILDFSLGENRVIAILRLEMDLPPWGIDANLFSAADVPISLHLSSTFVTTSHVCPTRATFTPTEEPSRERCGRPCLKTTFRLRNPVFGSSLVLRGNTYFVDEGNTFTQTSLAESLESTTIDRLVYDNLSEIAP